MERRLLVVGEIELAKRRQCADRRRQLGEAFSFRQSAHACGAQHARGQERLVHKSLAEETTFCEVPQTKFWKFSSRVLGLHVETSF